MMGKNIGNPSKVLFIVNSLSGGGAERVCVYLANATAKLCQTDMAVLYNDDDAPDLEGVNVVTLGMKRNSSKVGKMTQILAARNRLNKFIAEREEGGKYDLVTAHLTASHLVASASAVSDRCLYVHHSLLSAVEGLYPQPFMNHLKKLYRSSECVSVSEGVRAQAIERLGLDAGKITTIYNCVPLDAVVRGAGGTVAQERPFILCVGRLTDCKRFDRMIEAYAKGGFAGTHDLIFLGKGPMLEDLRHLAKERGVSDTTYFPGYVDNPYAWMAKSSAMVMTSDREALPTVLVEGLMAGAHVVSSDCDFGPREILSGELSGFLVAPDSIDGYVDAVRRAISAYPHVSEDYFRRYEADEVVKSYLARYKAVIAGGKEG